jgi:hypothetical protein
VKVKIGAVAFWHTAVVPVTVALGSGFIVTTALPVCDWLQGVDEPSETLTRAYVKVVAEPVGIGIETLLFPAPVDMVWLPPPFTV